MKRTDDYTGRGDTLTTTYGYNTKGTSSSGYLYSEPKYDYEDICQHLIVGASDLSKTNWLESGYHVGYGQITVRKSRGQAGTTVHTFSTYELAFSKPVPAALRGLARKTEQFSATGQLVQRDSTVYATVVTGFTNAARIYPNYYHRTAQPSGTSWVYQDQDVYFTVKTDAELAYWPRVTRRVETLFGTSGASLAQTQVTTHHYLPWDFQQTGTVWQTTQPVRTARTASDGLTRITQTRYAGQYALTGTDAVSQGLQTLVTNGMLSVPVEQQSWVRTGADSSVVGGQLTHYARYPSALGLPYHAAYPRRVWQLATARPLPASEFSGSVVQNGTFRQDPHYQARYAFTAYDTFGNLLQQQPVNGRPTSYLWGYAASQPIAEAHNAGRPQIAYTSFEPGATGRWRYDSLARQRLVATHVTGRWGYQLDSTRAGAVSCDRLPAGEYELLVWGHGLADPVVTGGSATPRHAVVATAGTSGWRLHRYGLTLPANATVQVNSAGQLLWIDELRLAPVGAQLSTYTYDPGVGRTSATDPTGRTVTYEYDALGRLVRTRDEQGRVLSQQQYHYAGH